MVTFSKLPKAPKKLDTPSKNGGQNSILNTRAVCIQLSSRPLVVHVGDTYKNPYSLFETTDVASLLAEKTFYETASLAPSWIASEVRKEDAKQNRDAVFPHTDGKRKFLEFANFEPELFTRVSDEERPAPGFNGEIKSAGTGKVMFDEIANYVLFSIIDSFFQANGKEGIRMFYEHPPVGFGLMGMAHVAYFVCMEVVGTAFITPCTKPFFLGSSDHENAVKDLPRFEHKYTTTHSLDCKAPIFEMCDKLRHKSVVTKEKASDGMFWKVIQYDAFAPEYFRRLHSVYSKYKELNASDMEKKYLIPAKLLYGELEVAVRTKFLDGYRAGIDDDMEDTVIMTQVAIAMVFLAKNGLLYTDLRPENFMVRTGGDATDVRLIDYDDIQILDEVVDSVDKFKNVIGQSGVPSSNNYMDDENAFFARFRECLTFQLSQ